jgi:hypothetical protein
VCITIQLLAEQSTHMPAQQSAVPHSSMVVCACNAAGILHQLKTLELQKHAPCAHAVRLSFQQSVKQMTVQQYTCSLHVGFEHRLHQRHSTPQASTESRDQVTQSTLDNQHQVTLFTGVNQTGESRQNQTKSGFGSRAAFKTHFVRV